MRAHANDKAALLLSVLEAAPQIESDTIILLTTRMSPEEIAAHGFYHLLYEVELHDSIFFTLYPDRGDLSAYFCLDASNCLIHGRERRAFALSELAELLPQSLVIALKPDLSAEIIADPLAYFALDSDIAYDANQLYEADAPLPPRAESMLGHARQP